MVGLVIVSHSRPLAQALIDLVGQVTEKEIPIRFAAGAGPDHQEFGTDALEIIEAVQAVYSTDGVLILMDMGSAVLSAEMALELLPPEMGPNIRFSAGPLIEGAIAAAVQVSLGSDLETVYREAQRALQPKSEHLGLEPEGDMAEVDQEKGFEPGTADSITVRLDNEHGLHARPAARFVQLAAGFDASIQVRNQSSGKGPVSARSLNALATLGAVRGDSVEISASGPQAAQALEALQALVADQFGETPGGPPPPATVKPPPADIPEGAIECVAVSEGIALGPAYNYLPPPPPVPDYLVEEPAPEWQRLQRALALVRTAIQDRGQELKTSLGEAQAAIFDAHLLILNDPELLDDARHRIFGDHQNAAMGWHGAIAEVAASYRALPDPYLQQRSIDVVDVGNQVLQVLAGAGSTAEVELSEPVVLIAHELTPTQTAQLDMSRVLGLVTVAGGPTSHSAILARALGIPAVSGVDASLMGLADGTELAVDGFRGLLYLQPSDQVRAELQGERESWLDQRDRLVATSHQPAVTLDGHAVEVVANAGNPQDAQAALANGAQGIGLLRTEFLFLTRDTPPSEDEQVEVLTQVGEIMGERPVIVRTLDVGGDKALPYIDLDPEANPFLGVRAIRLSLRKKELFGTQLTAILRAGAGRDFRIMFPMVTGIEEVRQARQLLEDAHKGLESQSLPHLWPVETGIMVETPASAVLSPQLASVVDFFSIGTNDLTQYTLAAERGNPHLAEYADALNPAVLRLVQTVVEAAHAGGKWVGVCGELAGDPEAASILVGLGVDELSMNPASIPKVKSVLRAIRLTAAQDLAGKALAAGSVQEVRGIAREFLDALDT